MRTLLHTPRTRARSIAAATLGALALISSVLVATPAQALSDTGTGGVFVPSTGRILDTKNSIGGYNTPMPAKTWRTITVSGKAGVPDDGTVGAVSVVATVADISTQGQLFGRPNANEPTTMMGIYGGEDTQNTSFSAVLAVDADGTIQVEAETASRLILDVQGYYTANTDGTAPGGFVPSNGKRIVDTRSGLGATKATVASGKSIDVQVTGTAGVPAGASGVIVNLIAVNTTDSVGYLTPYATGTTRPANSFNYAGGVATSMQAQVQLSASGKITIYNANSMTNILVDVQGYFTTAGKGGSAFTPGAGRAYDTRTGGRTALANNETRSIQIAGAAGVPVMGSGINAVVLTLTALKTTAGSGNATVWADGTARPNTTSINFDQTTIRTNTITVPIGANGKISLNNVAAATDYVLDVQGWYVNRADPSISCDKGADPGSWGTAQHTVENPVLCTVTAPAAAASDQTLEITANGMPIGSTELNQAGPTTLTAAIPPVSGTVTIQAAVADPSDYLHVSNYAFGVGDWTTVSMLPSVAEGTVVPQDVFLTTVLSDLGLFPADSMFKFKLTDITTGTSLTGNEWKSDPYIDPTVSSGLTRGHTYAWSATVKAASSWSSTSEATSPTWQFRVANEGEAVTPPPGESPEDADTVVFRTAVDKVNGCSYSPERWFKAYFHDVCNTHDRCYFSTSRTPRLACDNAFFAGLIVQCAKAYPKKGSISQNNCIGAAGIYFIAVRTGGKSHYKGKGSSK
ncbi:hypothetical protein [Curtobacterium sp. PsM8]|uniref:hypothetical protein n=1 Tax=Curtobacterium sp. PsM8 TaxID=3030532 RepID=UPI00263A51D7|nr:hypothetical protein [Curtobacterium sp. PsM8]MDN4648531.1 hypothetical protein [Curtobacterium sp. PsM8]